MFQIGCHLSVGGGYLSMGRTAVSIGANTFQFFTRNPRGGKARALDLEDVNAYRAFAAANGLGRLVAHAPYTLNGASPDPRVRRFALEAMSEDLARLEHLPGNCYNFHPGSHVGQGAEAGIGLIAELLDQVLDPGLSTTVLLETMSGKGSEIGGSFEELRAVIDRTARGDLLGVCLDVCHVHDAGYDIAGDLDGVLEEFDRIIGLDRLRAVHLNSSLHERGSKKDRHARIGEGAIGLEAIGRIINHPALRELPFCLETPNEAEGHAREIALLKTLRQD